jgi:hypothetical protein
MYVHRLENGGRADKCVLLFCTEWNLRTPENVLCHKQINNPMELTGLDKMMVEHTITGAESFFQFWFWAI